MGIFDSIMGGSSQGQSQPSGNKTAEVRFDQLPESLEAFKALPQAALTQPADTAALTALAFCYYPKDRELSLAMIDYLRGPRPLSPMEKQFIRDRFMDKDYVPRSYFVGATPQNDYRPAEPCTVRVSENPYSYQTPNMAKLYLTSSGADSPRAVELRLAKDGKWYLWEQYLLVGIREPESQNPWA